MLDLVDSRPFILHVALQTGDTRRSFREDIETATIEILRPLCAADGEHEIPSVPNRRLQVTRSGRLLLATVIAHAAIVSIAVADQSVGADRLWLMMHENAALKTHPDRPPREPWCASREEIGLQDCPEDRSWLRDFENCLAWTWYLCNPRRQQA
jgi:hypothetical protein